MASANGENAGMPEKSRKRSRKDEQLEEIEVDLDAPEPVSKKELRKAKKLKTKPSSSKVEKRKAINTPKGESDESDSESDPEAETSSDEPVQKPAAKVEPKFGVWIGNLPFTTTKDDVKNWLLTNSSIKEKDVTRIHLPAPARSEVRPGPRKQAVNKGFAYVDFTKEADMNTAIGLSEKLLLGRALLIKSSDDFKGRPLKTDTTAEGKPVSTKPPSNTVFVGNLSFETTVDDLKSLYGVCGTIARLHMATFEDTGKCKGFAWIEFEDIEASEAAMRGWVKIPVEADSDEEDENDNEGKKRSAGLKKRYVNRLNGRSLRMEFAEDKQTRYKKRFGAEKPAPRADGVDIQGGEDVEGDNNAIRVPNLTKPPRKEREKKALKNYTGQDSVVQKMTGGIVESKGKKIVFS
jgi:RNA recognition motif-containing protein